MYSTMTKGRPFSIYCIILFLCTEARENNHILLQRGMYLSQKWSTAPFCPPVHRVARPYGLCVLYDTAARVSEICSLCIEDVRFENPPHIRIMGKGMKVRAVPILPATAKNEKNPQPMGNWLRGNGKHSENSRKKLKIPLKNCKTGRRRRENSHQAAQQKSPIDLKWLDISIKRTLKIGHRLRWFCAIQQRQEPVTFFMSQALGAPEGIRTPGIWRRSLPTALPLPQTATQLSQSNSLS